MDVAGYEDLNFLGSGGSAYVYRATHSETGDVVAIKVLRGAGDEAVSERFEREGQTMSELGQLSHVVPVLESGFNDVGEPFIVMPLYTGGSLQQLLESAPVPWREAVGLVRKIAGAVSQAHAKSILHLDIKPANILLDDAGEPWLADFAISELMGATGSLSAKVLTPAYTPPERLDGEAPTEATDVYGLGATLFALLAGTAPFFHEDRTSPVAVMMAVVNDPIPVHELPGDVPGVVRNLLMASMAKERDDRPASAATFVSLLDDVLASDPIDAVAGSSSEVPTPLAAAAAAARAASISSGPERPAPQAITTGETIFPSGSSPLAVAVPPVLESDERRDNVMLVWVAAAVFLLVLAGSGVLVWSLGSRSGGGVATGAVPEQFATSGVGSVDAGVLGVSAVADALVEGEAETASPTISIPTRPAITVPTSTVPETRAPETLPPTTTTAAPTTTTSTIVPITFPDRPPLVIPPTTTTTTTTTTAAPTTTTTTAAPTTTTTAAPTTTTTTEPPPPATPPSAGFIASAGPPGSEQTMQFQNITSGDAVSFLWDFGDGTTSSEFMPSHPYATPGRYSVTITAFAADGTSSSTTHPVQVAENTG